MLYTHHVVFKGFSVPLFNHTEPSKLSLSTIKIPMMVGITGYKPGSAYSINEFYTLYQRNRKRKLCYPRFSGKLVGEIEFCRRCIVDKSLSSQVILHMHHEVRFLIPHQLDVAHR